MISGLSVNILTSDLCPSRETDLVLLGDCDKTVTRLADTIGWREDLEAVTVTSLEDALTN